MSNFWVFVGILLVVAVLPFILLAGVRLTVRAVPASFSRLAGFEQRHYRSYWLFFALMYVLIGIGHFVLAGNRVFGVLFVALGIAAAVRATRIRHGQIG